MKRLLMTTLMALTSSTVVAATQIELYEVDKQGTGKSLGTVEVHQSAFGLVFTPNLKNLSPGLHGFHVHENPSCDAAEKDGEMVPALAAGGHYDPYETGKHDTPWGSGHAGDLPALYVAEDGTATYPVLAPRLTLKDLQGRSLMIHAGGDNHADHPKPLGGGGARVACGVSN